MPKVQVYLRPEAYAILTNYRDTHNHPNLDEAMNALLMAFVNPWKESPILEVGDVVKFPDGEQRVTKVR